MSGERDQKPMSNDTLKTGQSAGDPNEGRGYGDNQLDESEQMDEPEEKQRAE